MSDQENKTVTNDNTALVAAPAPVPMRATGGRPLAIVPTDFDQAWKLALCIENSGMAPKTLPKAEQIVVAIMTGMELGLTPMAAVQGIAVINGRATIWGTAALAVVRSSGVLEYSPKEWIEGEGANRVAICEVKRRGDPEPIRRTFSMDDAKLAGLLAKAGPWKEYTARMLQMRARAFCLRDVFSDVLTGVYLREEIEDEAETPALAAPAEPARRAPRPADVLPQAAIEHKPAVAMETVEAQAPDADSAKDPAVVAAPAEPARRTPPRRLPTAEAATPAPVEAAAPAEDKPTFAKVLSTFIKAANAAQDDDALNAAWDSIIEPVFSTLTPEQQDDAQGVLTRRSRSLGDES